MIQNVELGTHRIVICMPSVSVRSCSAFIWILTCFFRRKSSKSNNVSVERGVAQEGLKWYGL